ncbi:MAG TPA: bifunctional UDP-N-acetylglucosamine diphosphorylase/glucosamine-1-phosphate N-acetyltransferase GlmU, partial [Gaiellales bacterium]|nr:bifunctional UDP-N-acetylglucosamine diphosphorylase/glucosamine-1-phosphate N-acetyltransferase GlmU [Gaiellales bacterium]
AELDPARTIVVVGAESEDVRAILPEGVEAVTQAQPLGTGDAARTARSPLEGFAGDVVVMNGDHPLTDPASLADLAAARAEADAAAAVLTFNRTETIGADFGRIVRRADGSVERIVELRDTSPDERALTEVNSGIYVFRTDLLWPALERLSTANDQGELYLTDAVGLLVGDGHTVAGHLHDDPTVALGINTRADLAAASALLRDRINLAHMLAGVTIVDPASTWIEPTVSLAADATIEPFTVLRGATEVAAGATVGPHAVVIDATIGPGASVGPFCYLRPGAELADDAKAGTFVEIKNSQLAAGVKVPHLSYIGDASIGEGTNIGAGGITANYDGRVKQRTTIGKDVHTSCDNVFVAPVTIGDGAWTAAGSVITEDVPPDALAVARAHQKNIEGYGRRKRG